MRQLMKNFHTFTTDFPSRMQRKETVRKFVIHFTAFIFGWWLMTQFYHH